MTGTDLTAHEDSGAAASGGPATESAPAGGGGAFASRPVSTGRRQEIESVMRTDIDRYYSEGMDREYATILADDVAAVNPDAVPATTPMHWSDSRNELATTPEGKALVQDWEMRGGFRPVVEIVQAKASEIVRGVGDTRAQRVFMEHFDRSLPESIRYPLYTELLEGLPTYVQPVDNAGLAKFGANEVGRELLAEWGSDAPERVAVAWRRVERIKRALGDDAPAFFEWFETLKPAEAKALMRAATR